MSFVEYGVATFLLTCQIDEICTCGENRQYGKRRQPNSFRFWNKEALYNTWDGSSNPIVIVHVTASGSWMMCSSVSLLIKLTPCIRWNVHHSKSLRAAD